MHPRAMILSMLLVVPAFAGPCTHDEFRKSLDDHCVQLTGDGTKAFNDGLEAEKAGNLPLAKETYGLAFKMLRQAGRLGARPEAKTLTPAVVRLVLVKATEASKRHTDLGRRMGGSAETLQQELDNMKQQADIEMQQRLDCIEAFLK